MFKHTSNLKIYKQDFRMYSPTEVGVEGVVRSFTYSSNGDTNDVGYWLGTKGNTVGFDNPAKPSTDGTTPDILIAGRWVAAATTTSLDRQAHVIWGRNNSGSYCYVQTSSDTYCTVVFCFTKGRKFRLRRYTSQSATSTYSFNGHCKSWQISGSLDGVNWVVLDDNQNVTNGTANYWYTSSELANNNFFNFYKIYNTSGLTNTAIFTHYLYGDLFIPLGLSY